MLDDTGIDDDLELLTTQMGYEGKGVEPIVKAISDAHEIVAGKPLRPIDPVENSMWTDTNLYNELNIPAVKLGIGAASRAGPDGELHNMVRLRDSTSVDDLLNATKIYAISALQLWRGVARARFRVEQFGAHRICSSSLFYSRLVFCREPIATQMARPVLASMESVFLQP